MKYLLFPNFGLGWIFWLRSCKTNYSWLQRGQYTFEAQRIFSEVTPDDSCWAGNWQLATTRQLACCLPQGVVGQGKNAPFSLLNKFSTASRWRNFKWQWYISSHQPVGVIDNWLCISSKRLERPNIDCFNKMLWLVRETMRQHDLRYGF